MPEDKKSIKELVVERLAKSGPISHERLVDALAQVEEDRRHDLLLKAFKSIEDAEIQVKNTSRPDVQTFNGDGTPASSVFSPGALKNMKSSKEKLAKLQGCFDRCLEAPTAETFKELAQLVAQSGNAKAPSAEEVRAGG